MERGPILRRGRSYNHAHGFFASAGFATGVFTATKTYGLLPLLPEPLELLELPDPLEDEPPDDPEPDPPEPDELDDDGGALSSVLGVCPREPPPDPAEIARGFSPMFVERYVISGFMVAARSYTEVVFGEPFGTRYPSRISSLSRYGVSTAEWAFGTRT